jgi:hypothetical protein
LLEFLETRTFSRAITTLLSDSEYAELQGALMVDPAAGDLIPGTGGLRKLRWTQRGRGKRGGVRVIYYWYVGGDLVYMLLVYSKAEQVNLGENEKRFLKKLVAEEFK